MKAHLVVVAFMLGAIVFAQESNDSKAATLADAKQFGWKVVSTIAESVGNEKNYEAKSYPGNAAWFAELRNATKGCDPAKPIDQWPVIDGDKLITHNPRYWQMHFEVAPADPMLALLHAGLLQMSGSTERSSYLVVIAAQGPALPPESLTLIKSLVLMNNGTLTKPHQLMNQGIALHDKGDFDGALAKHDAALKLHPRYGVAWYERGYALRAKAWKAAGVPEQKSNVIVNDEKLPEDPKEVTEAFAKARLHDPFQYMAYQGRDKQVIDGVMVLAEKGIPAWKKVEQGFGKQVSDATIRNLAEALQIAGAHDLAIEARQVLIARRGNYAPEDYSFLEKSLKALAQGPPIEQTLAKLRGQTMAVRQFSKLTAPLGKQGDESKKAKKETDFQPKAADLDRLTLLNPTTQFSQRIGEIEPFGDYVKTVWQKADEIVAKAKPADVKAKGLVITVGVKSKNKARVWCDAVEGEIPGDLLRQLETELAQVEAIDLQQAPVAFALNMKLFHRQPTKFEKIPPSLTDAAKKQGIKTIIPPDELFKKIWPD
jgi:tetratricopeptide (TPR) repeat protein